MNDDSPFASFVPSTETPAAPETPAKNKGKRVRKGKGAKAETKKAAVEAPPSPAPVVARKTRKSSNTVKASRAMKIDPMLIFGACVGLGLDVVPVIAKIVETLQKLPKKSRARVVAALAKIFA